MVELVAAEVEAAAQGQDRAIPWIERHEAAFHVRHLGQLPFVFRFVNLYALKVDHVTESQHVRDPSRGRPERVFIDVGRRPGYGRQTEFDATAVLGVGDSQFFLGVPDDGKKNQPSWLQQYN